MFDRRVWLGFITIVLVLTIITFGGDFFPISMIDYAVYWSAARINIEGGNPYDTTTMLAKQEEIEINFDNNEKELMMYWYPPWSLALFFPFGLLPYKNSQILWYLFSIIVMMFSAVKLWRYYGGEENKTWLAWILAFTFSPLWFTLYLGQVGQIILLGITSFLILADKKQSNPKRCFFAGFCIGFISIKPSQSFLFWIILLLWILEQQNWSVFIGLLSSLIVGSLLAMTTNHDVLLQYFEMIPNQRATDWAVATIGSWLRTLHDPNQIWIQFIPALLGLVWVLFYWFREHRTWSWRKKIPLIMLVSLVTSPFAATHDQVFLLPAVIVTAVQIVDFPRFTSILICIFWLIFNSTTFLLHLTRGDQFFFWQAPLLLFFYVIINRIRFITPQLNTT